MMMSFQMVNAPNNVSKAADNQFSGAQKLSTATNGSNMRYEIQPPRYAKEVGFFNAFKLFVVSYGLNHLCISMS